MDTSKIKTELTMVNTDRNKYGYRLIADHAYITFKNFAGEPDPIYNKNGNRTFLLYFKDAEMATKLQNDGWYVTAVMPKFEGDEIYYKLKVTVASGGRSINKGSIVRNISGMDFEVDDETVAELDKDYFTDAKVVINPGENKAQPGRVCAYLYQLKVWVEQSESYI